MHLIYLDETGNTGNNLSDPQQPIFVLAALIVPEDRWIKLEANLQQRINHFFPDGPPPDFELHAKDLRNGSGPFRGQSVESRLSLWHDCLQFAVDAELRLIYRSIAKRRYHKWLIATFGHGVEINPHVVAFALLAQVVNEHLASLPGNQLGIFISDENKDVMKDVEKSLRALRGLDGALQLSQIVEKGFFIESHSSLLLQLCDLCTFPLRKHEEHKAGRPLKTIDETAINLVEPLIHRGNESWQDVLAWIAQQQKKERPGDKPRVD